jgi:hypothetical protein
MPNSSQTKVQINQLLDQLAILESTTTSRFLAPCVPNGRVQVKIAGLVYAFMPRPRDFCGWGIFQPQNEKYAQLIKSASFFQVMEYLQHLPQLRLHLVEQIQEQIWFGFPVNLSEANQRFGVNSLLPIYLVNEGERFDTVSARTDGQSWWFEEVDRRADVRLAEQLRQALQAVTLPAQLKISKLTPELRESYEKATYQAAGFEKHYQQWREVIQANNKQREAKKRLQNALAMGGGELKDFQDKGAYWLVEWKTSYGASHTSAIAKKNLTVISAGICLDGQDRDFDLQSLVGVVEGGYY